MREAIKRVIAYLETERDKADTSMKYAIEEYTVGACAGRFVAFSTAINRLKEVLESHEPERHN